jgi:hypothetical protein
VERGQVCVVIQHSAITHGNVTARVLRHQLGVLGPKAISLLMYLGMPLPPQLIFQPVVNQFSAKTFARVSSYSYFTLPIDKPQIRPSSQPRTPGVSTVK